MQGIYFCWAEAVFAELAVEAELPNRNFAVEVEAD